MMIQLLLALLVTASSSEDDALDQRMHERFSRATLIQTAVIDGDLQAAHRWAGRLEGIAPDREIYADVTARFGELAAEISRADTLPAAAALVGELAGACGDCHQSHDVPEWRFENATETPTGNTVLDRMARHIWAADRLWEGLIGRHEGAWVAGAEALAEEPMSTTAFTDPDRAGRYIDRLGEFARDALTTVEWSSRDILYGQGLAICAGCHEEFRNSE